MTEMSWVRILLQEQGLCQILPDMGWLEKHEFLFNHWTAKKATLVFKQPKGPIGIEGVEILEYRRYGHQHAEQEGRLSVTISICRAYFRSQNQSLALH